MKMKQIIAIFSILLFHASALSAQKSSHAPRYHVLDQEIELSASYDAAKEHKIDSLRLLLNTTRNRQKAHRLSFELGEQYHSFVNDSCLHYYKKAIGLARQIGDRNTIFYDKLMLINQYIYSSNHKIALSELEGLNAEELPDSIISRYYLTFGSLYEYMGNESSGDEREHYHQLAQAFNDSAMATAGKDSQLYYQEQCSRLIRLNKIDEAAEVCNQWAQSLNPEERNYAVMAYYQAEIASHRGNKEERKYWLVESSINDIRHCTKHQMSLWNLAQMLADEDDSNRSYKYVEHSWKCVQKFNAGMLTSLISPVFTTINDSYNNRLQRANRRMTILAIAAGLLALGLGVSYGFTRRRGKLLEKARTELAENNQKLSTLNGQLSTLNTQLSSLNGELSTSNAQLSEANRLKEEYIGQFFSICSQYIDKLDKYRLKINRKIIAGQSNDVIKITASEQLREDEQKELLANFDRIFLGLFPNFVDRFNALLEPEGRITPHGQQLTTTLRIFALIRLGIEDSASIAEFLNYPAGTIYNYRNRIKVKSLGERNQFEDQVKRIGMD